MRIQATHCAGLFALQQLLNALWTRQFELETVASYVCFVFPDVAARTQWSQFALSLHLTESGGPTEADVGDNRKYRKRFENQKLQQELYFWRNTAITLGIFVITLILYIWGKKG